MATSAAPADIVTYELAADIRNFLRSRPTPIEAEVGLADILRHLASHRFSAVLNSDIAAAICFGEDAGWWEIIVAERCLVWTALGARDDA